MTTHFDKKIAFITGANRGIGLETARQLGKLGVFPVIGARTAQAGRDAVAALRAGDVDADSIVFDVNDASAYPKAVEHFYRESREARYPDQQCRREFGGRARR